MPTSMLWRKRRPDALATLERSESKVIDRQTLQILLGIQKTEAWVLMRRWGATRVGTSLALDRETLLRALRAER
jgi:hypothetical protein